MNEQNLWIDETDGVVTLGLTSEAQEELGKINFVTFPEIGAVLQKGEAFIEMEAEKAVIEYVAPLSGTVLEINEEAKNNPAVLDSEDVKQSWLVRLQKA